MSILLPLALPSFLLLLLSLHCPVNFLFPFLSVSSSSRFDSFPDSLVVRTFVWFCYLGFGSHCFEFDRNRQKKEMEWSQVSPIRNAKTTESRNMNGIKWKRDGLKDYMLFFLDKEKACVVWILTCSHGKSYVKEEDRQTKLSNAVITDNDWGRLQLFLFIINQTHRETWSKNISDQTESSRERQVKMCHSIFLFEQEKRVQTKRPDNKIRHFNWYKRFQVRTTTKQHQ